MDHSSGRVGPSNSSCKGLFTVSTVLCVGVGHVGLPLSLKLWEVGHDVILVDIDTDKIVKLGHGQMPFLEKGCDEILARAAGNPRFRPITYEDPNFEPAVESAEY